MVNQLEWRFYQVQVKTQNKRLQLHQTPLKHGQETEAPY